MPATAMSLVKLLQDATGKRSLWDIVKQAGVYIVRSCFARFLVLCCMLWQYSLIAALHGCPDCSRVRVIVCRHSMATGWRRLPNFQVRARSSAPLCGMQYARSMPQSDHTYPNVPALSMLYVSICLQVPAVRGLALQQKPVSGWATASSHSRDSWNT